jgi:chaperonin GroEL (HSP60 family)
MEENILKIRRLIFCICWDFRELRQMLERCAATALNSKLIGSHKAFFAPMIVDAILHLDDDQDLSLIGINRVPGGSVEVRITILINYPICYLNELLMLI